MVQGATDVNRRRVLKALGAGAGASLAGCLGGSNVDGERVPDVIISYWSDVGGGTAMFENQLPVIQESLNKIGITVDISPTEFTTDTEHTLNDTRSRHISFFYYTPQPGRLDPHQLLNRFNIEKAGSGGGQNPAHYTSCEYTTLVEQQVTQPDQEERQQTVTEAMKMQSEEAVTIPTSPYITIGAIRSDNADLGGTGDIGIQNHNPDFYIKTTPTSRDYLSVDASPVTVETTNYPVLDSTPSLSMWNQLFQSPLLQYGADLELTPMLAEEYSVSDDGTRIEFSLRDGAQFHNGDPVTAEDVQFTFNLLQENTATYTHVDPAPINEIEAVDDSTIVFHLEEPFAPVVSRLIPSWGIMHKDTWEGAMDDPGGFEPDEMIGSGPFEFADMSAGDYMSLNPADTHPVYSPDHQLEIQAFRDESSKFQAFQNGEVDVMTAISFSVYENIQEDMSDTTETTLDEGWHPFSLIPQHQHGPGMFQEFRTAIGRVLDRSLINEVAFYGEGYEISHGAMFTRTHPFMDESEMPKYTEEPTGDPDAARQVLEDEGWQWDSNDNLYYPPDQDLSPKWPEGETPDPNNFECLNSDGEFVMPDQSGSNGSENSSSGNETENSSVDS